MNIKEAKKLLKEVQEIKQNEIDSYWENNSNAIISKIDDMILDRIKNGAYFIVIDSKETFIKNGKPLGEFWNKVIEYYEKEGFYVSDTVSYTKISWKC